MITEAYVAGLTQENARKLLDRAAELGLPASVVKTVDGGFIVPGVLVEDDPKPALTGTGAREDEPDGDDTAPEPEDEPTPEPEPEPEAAPKRRAPARRTKNKAADDDSTADAVTDEE